LTVPLVSAYFSDVAQVALVAMAAALMVISINAYRKRSEGRYLALAVAFVCLCAASASTMSLELFTGLGPATVRVLELDFIPSLELSMVLSFLLALVWPSLAKPHRSVVASVAVVALGVAVAAIYLSNPAASGPDVSVLPAGCVKPAAGFLIIASSLGYNDSVAHGAPIKAWPLIDAPVGSNVTITICNTYQQAVGFQVAHYLQDRVMTVMPGETLSVNFIADQKGDYFIYCSILCPIHVYLQGGDLKVS
jgi:hypothetical protein